jgi:DNA-binding NarL/FixJ family response regulator
MGQSGKVPLFLADEQALFRQGLARQLSLYPDLDILGEAASDEEALAALQGLPPCVMVVCSLSLTPFQGLVRKVHHHLPAGSILAVADVKDPEAIFQAASSGAEAILPRGTGAESWAQTVRDVHGGGHPIDRDLAENPEVARRFLDEFQELFSRPGLTTLLIDLSPLEGEVLRRLASWMPLAEIGVSLQITPQDLHRHLTSIRRKLEANTGAQETVLALWGDKEERK